MSNNQYPQNKLEKNHKKVHHFKLVFLELGGNLLVKIMIFGSNG